MTDAGIEGRGRTDIIRVELIHSNQHTKSGRPQRPRRNRANDGKFTLVDVINQDSIKLRKTLSRLSWHEKREGAPRYDYGSQERCLEYRPRQGNDFRS